MRHQGHPVVDHVSACRRSGLSVVAYCRQAGISGNTYYYWRKRLLQREAVVARPAAGMPFLEIAARASSPSGYALRFQRSGVDLLVCKGFDTAEVKTLAGLVCWLEAAGLRC